MKHKSKLREIQIVDYVTYLEHGEMAPPWTEEGTQKKAKKTSDVFTCKTSVYWGNKKDMTKTVVMVLYIILLL